MPEKRRTRADFAQAKVHQTTTQTTLKGLFQRTKPGAQKVQNAHPQKIGPIDPSSPVVNVHCPTTPPPKPPKPAQLFPIFTKVASARKRGDTVINVDDSAVIDVTDTSDIDLSTQPPSSSTRPPSPCLGLGHASSLLVPPSPTALSNHGYENNTRLLRTGAQEDAHVPETSKARESSRRILSSGDTAPFPSSCSQHVRAFQHSYTFTRAPPKRSVFTSVSPSPEGTLDFLARWRQVVDTPLAVSNRNHQSLTPQQREKYLQSLSCDYVESHPAFAQLSIHQGNIPLYQTETWTRRFRPRRANQVLGNEQRATYLRDWLSVLELRLRDRQPNVPATENEKIERVEPRGIKRRRVVRTVTKRRSNRKGKMDSDDDLDDFVVSGDTNDLPVEDSDEELAFCQRTLAHLHRRDTANAKDTCPAASNTPAAEINYTTSRFRKSAQADFADNLTNTLLITGPPGCGKTAAVYACAEELGWDIFEVYPGIGKRNGASLDHLIGDVGRNHIVRTVQQRVRTKRTTLEVKGRVGTRGYLATSKTGRLAGSEEPSREAGTEGQPISVEDDSPTDEAEPLPPDEEKAFPGKMDMSDKCRGESDGSGPIVGQSLVLLEEVDILFKEDAGFWPAVVEFIQRCQRPVVMTCNDPGLVPLDELPLQQVLVFESCASSVASTFLQCLLAREGWLVPHEDLMALYESTYTIEGLDIPDAPLYPRTGPVPLPDLRRSITQLQMVCAGAKHGSASEMHQDDEAEGHVRRSGGPISAESRVTAMACTTERELWRQMKRRAEVMSHVDAELRRPLTTWEGVSTSTGSDEEVGYVGLCLVGEREGLVYWERDELIAEEAIRQSRGGHEENGTGPMEASIDAAARLAREEARGFGARVEYQSRMVYALQEVLGPMSPLVPQTSVFLDYIPWVRYMVGTDDELERRAMVGMVGGRNTRNSMRTRHTRTVEMGEGQRAALMGGRLVWSAGG